MSTKTKLKITELLLTEYSGWYQSCNMIRNKGGVEAEHEDEKGVGMYWDLAIDVAYKIRKNPTDEFIDDIYSYIKYGI